MADSWPPKDAWQLIDEARGKTLGAALMSGLLGMWYAFTQGINGMINAAFALMIDPVFAMIAGVVGVVDALWGGWQDILRAGAETAVTALAPGSAWAVGPFTQALSVLSIGVSLYLVAALISAEWTSNLVPTLLVDNRLVAFLTTTPEEEEEGTE